MSGYSKEYEIFYFQVDQFGEASVITILDFLEDCAIAHSEAVGLGIESLLEQRTCWVLNRWRLEMERYPRLGEKVTIETLNIGFERFYGERVFTIRDSQGNIIGKAGSLWIYLNIDKRRPTRIPLQFADQYGVPESYEGKEPFEDLPEITDIHTEIRFHVRRSDIDTNGHVNNTRYVEWMLEGISEESLKDYRLRRLEVIYKKETPYGTDILSQGQGAKDAGLEYLHRVLDQSGERELACGRTVWTKR
ncbi:acyl-[acyl-carrier-protein] thioesterase [Desulfitobacterium chlororespirans]|uniref:Acyl-ACP thioesterase n=1 Tax=Desulfitobacterium chlororespirans DSM 11544 TaxID=1121395 RepID=A0A1M7UR65_9FIRM|nr:acyl-ACP thioesterase domain-containing protein [Desulfitobacterium chlororespirans]SHN85376.1 Acyl-ACP thioesterase [Desulfitobacterium chlororespirans DSM 11544]